MNHLTMIWLILFIILVCLIWKNDIINRPIILLPLVFGCLIIFSINRNDNVEHMTNEAISNCSSLFNGGNGKVQNLDVTGDAKINNLSTNSSINILGAQNKNTQWALHPPDDGRNSLWIAPRKAGSDWDWGNSIQTDNKGNLQSNILTTRNNIINFGNGWSIDASDGHIRFKFNGDQKYVFHNDGALWTKPEGYYRDVVSDLRNNYIKYGQTISIHGRRGMLDNWAARCNDGDSDRDVGMGCSEGIGGDTNWKWQIRKR